MAQALVRFLANQYVERDGVQQRFFAGCFGIFGHGNVAGVGQALQQYADDMPYYQARNEQAMVHAASAYARQKNRLQTLACTTSIGPGATNMVTGAALATINRLPVLLLPGDIFASRGPDPVLQQLEAAHDGTLSVNDCFRPVSRYFDRIVRPEQIIPAALAAMRVLTNQAETGAVTLALPQDVQAEAYDYPEEFFEKRVWRVGRPMPEAEMIERAAALVREAEPADDRQRRGNDLLGGDGSLEASSPNGPGSRSPRRRPARARCPTIIRSRSGPWAPQAPSPPTARPARLTSSSGSAPAGATSPHPPRPPSRTRTFDLSTSTSPTSMPTNTQVSPWLETPAPPLKPSTGRWRITRSRELTGSRAQRENAEWDSEVERLYDLNHGPLPAQSEVIGAVNSFSEPKDVVVCAAGSMPGDLHKLWRTRDPKGYHVEYGYSTMGYEIAGGLGIKMAAPEREVYVMCGDGSYLMMNSEIVTSIQEGHKLTIVLVDNSGFSSIGALSRSVGSRGLRHPLPLPQERLHRPRLRERAGRSSAGGPSDKRREPRRARDPGRGHRRD